MKNKILIISIICIYIIILLGVFVLVKKNNQNSVNEEITIALNKESYQLKIDETTKLMATVSPNKYTDIEWESKNEKVATVNQDGIVKGVSIGKTYIIAKIGDEAIARCEIIVSQDSVIEIRELKINKSTLSLKVDEEEPLIVSTKPENVKDKTLKWESSDTEVVEVDQKGIVKAKKAGKATITITSINGVKITCDVVVEKKDNPKEENKKEDEKNEVKVDITGLDISNKNIEMLSTDTEKINVTITPSNATEKNLSWTSSNPNVATVDIKGNVKAVSKGETTITVTAVGGKTATSHVKVKHNILLIGNSKMYRPESKFVEHRVAEQFLYMAKEGGYIDEMPSDVLLNEKFYIPELEVSEKNKRGYVSKSADATIATINGTATIHKKGRLDEYINKDRYDIVIVLDGSKNMNNYSFEEIRRQSVDDGISWLKSTLKDFNGQIYFRTNWPDNTDNNYRELSTIVSNNGKTIADKYGFTLIDDARVFLAAKEAGIQTYNADDDIHTNARGTYLIAACMYAKVFHEDPRNIKWHDYLKKESTINPLKEIAYTYCY